MMAAAFVLAPARGPICLRGAADRCRSARGLHFLLGLRDFSAWRSSICPRLYGAGTTWDLFAAAGVVAALVAGGGGARCCGGAKPLAVGFAAFAVLVTLSGG